MFKKSIFALLLLVVTAPTLGGSFHYHALAILGAAEVTGVDAAVLAAVAKKESEFKSYVKSVDSTAGGLFQFTDKTWDAVLKEYGEKHNIPQNASKYNAEYNTIMAAELMAYNRQYLYRTLGRYPTYGELYLAHLLGENWIKELLLANGETKAASLLPRAARNNRSIFYTESGKPRTVKQLRMYIDWKFGVSVRAFEDEYFRYLSERY